MARKKQTLDETNGAAARHSVERLVSRFGVAVKVLRQSKRMTGPELAQRAVVSKGLISVVENENGNVTLETLAKLAAALEMTPSDLLRACG